MKKLKNIISLLAIFVLCACSPIYKDSGVNDNKLVKTEKLIKEKLKTSSQVKIEPLKGGLSDSSLYKIKIDERNFVIRFIDHRSLEDRNREIDAQKKASEYGYGPKIYYSSLNEGIIIMEFLQNQPLTPQIRSSSSFYQSLGSLVKTIHSGPNFLKGESNFEHISKNIEEVKWNDHIKSNEKVIKNILNRIQRIIEKHPEITPTHRDLNPNNIIFSNRKAFAIDYENASQDNPYFDLGAIGIFYLFDEKSVTIFLTTYLGYPPTQREKSKFFLMKQVSLLYYGIELLTKMPHVKINESLNIIPLKDVFTKIDKKELDLESPYGKLILSQSMVQEAINNSKTSYFEKALKILENNNQLR